jgi:hypothetical protein
MCEDCERQERRAAAVETAKADPLWQAVQRRYSAMLEAASGQERPEDGRVSLPADDGARAMAVTCGVDFAVIDVMAYSAFLQVADMLVEGAGLDAVIGGAVSKAFACGWLLRDEQAKA